MHRLKLLKFKLTRLLNSFIYHPTPVLFDHIPKCAGNAVINNLLRFYHEHETYNFDGVHFRESVKAFLNLPKEEQSKYNLIYGHSANLLIDAVKADTKILTILRDPIDRVISHYYYIKTYKGHFLHDTLINDHITLEDYCAINLSNDLQNEYVVHFSGLSVDEVRVNPKRALELAEKNILSKYDLIGFQSNLKDFFLSFSKMMNLPSQKISDKPVNKTSKRQKVSELNEETLSGIKKFNQLDIQFYDRMQSFMKQGVIQKN